ncbi:hypothetical protein QTJ16_002792 [Diplocarpon rosae]|uniref:Copper transport protein n=1 Tax=Diplocarpon rosae TaxID=946125 RepID=A0AAD9T2D0_9HELO|nr:hypothetical protein QTJ16_002792 [Diplocarpon rosae]
MGHSHMDHAAMGHGGMDMGGPARCNMNMLFTWDTTNLCIVFRWWHIRTTSGLLFSLLAVVVLTAAYEAIRSASRRYENFVARKTSEVPNLLRVHVDVSSRLGTTGDAADGGWCRLLFMTYNGWVMFAMAVGAFVGYLVFGNNTSATKDSACH